MGESFNNFGEQINNSFFFVVDKIVDLQAYFIWYAKGVGRVVFLIAILSAALNYALTGTGLKENLIKIFKATVFFLIVISFYPRIVSWITAQTFIIAQESMRKSIESYFVKTEQEIIERTWATDEQINAFPDNPYKPVELTTTRIIKEITTDNRHLLDEIFTTREQPYEYTTVAPASLIKMLFFIANDMLKFADNNSNKGVFSNFSHIFKGLICGIFVIATGCFALLEYLMCFLEFMLVTSVGVILFPLSIWEGSKFMAEKFIGAIVGFFMKMLFCNIAIFLLLYGFISITNISQDNHFSGLTDQIIFTIFTCLLFFFICKSAPGVAQSLLTGTPSLSATGAISAAAGMVGAAAGVAGLAGKAAGAVAGGGAKAGFGLVGSVAGANAAKHSAMDSVKQAGGSLEQQEAAGGKAFRSSFASDMGDSIKGGAYGLTRRLLGDKQGGGMSAGGGGTNPHSWRQDFLNNQSEDPYNKGGHQTIREHMGKRKEEGNTRGKQSAEKYISNNKELSANREMQKDPDYSSSLNELNKEFPGTKNSNSI